MSRRAGPVAVLIMIAAAALVGCGGNHEPAAHTSPGAFSYSPASDRVFRCLIDKGWDVQITWDGGITAGSDTIPNAQYSSYKSDSDACWSAVDDRILAMTPAEISRAYAEEVKTRDCLIGLGYAVDEPPSAQTYADGFFGERWTAYGASSIVSRPLRDEEWERVGKTCVQPSWSFGAAEDPVEGSTP